MTKLTETITGNTQ